MWVIVMVERATMVAPHATTESATRWTSLGMRRPNACTDWRPFASDHTASASTASVVTLMPPAVDADPPPTNMSIDPTMSDEPWTSPMSTTENPPERVIAERKNDWKIVSHAFMLPNVSGLSYSRVRNAAAPAKKSSTVVMIVSFACSDHCRTCHWCFQACR